MITHANDPRPFRRYAQVEPDGTVRAFTDIVDGGEVPEITGADFVDVTDTPDLFDAEHFKDYERKPRPAVVPAVDWTTATGSITLTAADLASLQDKKGAAVTLIDAKIKALRVEKPPTDIEHTQTLASVTAKLKAKRKRAKKQ